MCISVWSYFKFGPNAPEITEVVGPNTVVRKDGRIIRRYRTHTGVISQD